MNKHIHAFHNGKKDYKCELCEILFTFANNLKMHIKRVHDGRKCNKCDICDKSFVTPQNLQRHIKYSHENNRLECDSCGKSFSRSIDLKKHFYKVHEGQRYKKIIVALLVSAINCKLPTRGLPPLFQHLDNKINRPYLKMPKLKLLE